MSKSPDFTQIDYQPQDAQVDLSAWSERVERETGQSPEALVWQTLEQIPVKPLYIAEDLQGMEHLDFVAGIQKRSKA